MLIAHLWQPCQIQQLKGMLVNVYKTPAPSPKTAEDQAATNS